MNKVKYEDNPLVSVIVPAYNEEKNINRCITSIRAQEYSNLEIIIVDDGSTDSTGAICDSISTEDERICVIHKPNGGQSSARNAGLKHIHGELVCFVDSDDWIDAKMINYLVGLYKAYRADVSEISYVQCSKEVNVIQKQEKIEIIQGHDDILATYLENGMKAANSYPVWNKMYTRNILENMWFIDNQLYEDILFNFNVLKKANKYVVSNCEYYKYFINLGSTTRKPFINKNLMAVNIGKDIREYTDTSDSIRLKNAGEITLARRYFMCVCSMLKYGADNKININNFIDDAIYELRRCYKGLMFSKMALKRKLVLTIVVINKNLIKTFVNKRSINMQ